MSLVMSSDLKVWQRVSDAAAPLAVELINGEVVIINSPLARHQRLLGRIYTHALGVFPDSADVLLGMLCIYEDGQDHRVIPDLVVFPAGVVADNDAEAPLSDAVLAVEVLSPSTEHIDRGSKWTLYAEAGVQEMWLADPVADTVMAYVLTAQGEWGEGQLVELND